MSGCVKSLAALTVLAFVQSGCATAQVADAADRIEDDTRIEKSETPSSTLAPPMRRSTAAETGTATWYGPGLEGKTTASGERFSSQELTAAHKTLPFGTRVRVTTLDTLASVVVTINDRLPAASRHVIDLSQAAGKVLRMIGAGIARVRIEILE